MLILLYLILNGIIAVMGLCYLAYSIIEFLRGKSDSVMLRDAFLVQLVTATAIFIIMLFTGAL